jgi:hypothetical protein
MMALSFEILRHAAEGVDLWLGEGGVGVLGGFGPVFRVFETILHCFEVFLPLFERVCGFFHICFLVMSLLFDITLNHWLGIGHIFIFLRCFMVKVFEALYPNFRGIL